MGDPSHVVNQTQDVGTSTKNGLFPRQNIAACGSSTKFTQSYCNSNDEFCDSGTSLEVHISYVTNFGAVAAQYIQQRVGNATTSATGTGTARQLQSPGATGVSAGSSRGELKGWWRWSLALGLVSAFAFGF
jgi:acetylxylan esterase